MNDKPKSGGFQNIPQNAPLEAKPVEKTEPPPDPETGKRERIGAVLSAARVLRDGWTASAFYDRQDPVEAEALIDALDQLKKGDA